MPTVDALRRATTTGVLVGAAAALVAIARPRPAPRHEQIPEPPTPLPPGRIVPVPGHGELVVRDTHPDGGGDDVPPVVLLHGWMFPADLNWHTCYAPLGERGRVLAPDHRGHGRGLRAAVPFRLTDVADDVAALIRELDVGPVVAVGYSMGGPIAQLLAQRHPDVIRGLVLCATAAAFNARPRERWVWRGMGALQVVLRLAPRHWWERAWQAQMDGRLPIRLTRMITEDTPEELAEHLAWVIGELDRGSAEDIAEAGRELGRYDGRDWVGTLDLPTAVIITARDSLVPARHQEQLAALIPNARRYVVDGDHDAVAANADTFVPTLLAAVDAVTVAGELDVRLVAGGGGEE